MLLSSWARMVRIRTVKAWGGGGAAAVAEAAARRSLVWRTLEFWSALLRRRCRLEAWERDMRGRELGGDGGDLAETPPFLQEKREGPLKRAKSKKTEVRRSARLGFHAAWAAGGPTRFRPLAGALHAARGQWWRRRRSSSLQSRYAHTVGLAQGVAAHLLARKCQSCRHLAALCCAVI